MQDYEEVGIETAEGTVFSRISGSGLRVELRERMRGPAMGHGTNHGSGCLLGGDS